ncbi:FecR family protein [Bacteroides sp.]|uniref:FecR family protein n=1 Tax=Bacteroides sp. TaxID=29523 RepID=UPI002616C2DA|nr:FecR family protein [Bacteroides sp.]
MEYTIIYRIIRKYLSDRFSSETEEKVQKWIIKDKDADEKEQASLAYWNTLEQRDETETSEALTRVNRRINYSRTRQFAFRKKIARVAAVLIPLFMLAGGYLYYTSTTRSLIEVYAAYGEKKHLILPDSSEIWLNAGTTFKYPETFTGEERLVYLDGEAYFSVKKDASRPFIVKASQMSVTVLGTRFNVKAYPDDERITTTLSSGKVEINVPSQSPEILSPNEQLTYNKKTSHISVAEIPAADTDSWVTGKLIFTNTSLTEIQQTLKRRYNVTFSNHTSLNGNARYTVRFLQNENLEQVLNVLGDIVGIDYRKNGTHIELINIP